MGAAEAAAGSHGAPVIELSIAVEAPGWASFPVESLVRQAVAAALAVAPDAPGGAVGLDVLLADDEAVQDLNRAWRGKDKPTNVLSFPAPPGLPRSGPRHLGDVVLAFETLAREAEDEGKALSDHLLHLVVHATLHLLGRDHGTDAEAEAMEALEVEALARLGVADPYRPADA